MAAPIRRSVCKYYTRGFCHHGENCAYAHGEAMIGTRVGDAFPADDANDWGSDKNSLDEPRKVQVRHWICKHWQVNDCWKGDACSFAHGKAAMGTKAGEPNPPSQQERPADDGRPVRQRLCLDWRSFRCPKGESCSFAHGNHNIGTKVGDPNPDTAPPKDEPVTPPPSTPQGPAAPAGWKEPCRHWMRGFCERGDQCSFEHSGVRGAGRPSAPAKAPPPPRPERPAAAAPATAPSEKLRSWKTKFCKSGQACSEILTCPNAHFEHELRQPDEHVPAPCHRPHSKKKFATLCPLFAAAKCPDGPKCLAAHGLGELEVPVVQGWDKKGFEDDEDFLVVEAGQLVHRVPHHEDVSDGWLRIRTTTEHPSEGWVPDWTLEEQHVDANPGDILKAFLLFLQGKGGSACEGDVNIWAAQDKGRRQYMGNPIDFCRHAEQVLVRPVSQGMAEGLWQFSLKGFEGHIGSDSGTQSQSGRGTSTKDETDPDPWHQEGELDPWAKARADQGKPPERGVPRSTQPTSSTPLVDEATPQEQRTEKPDNERMTAEGTASTTHQAPPPTVSVPLVNGAAAARDRRTSPRTEPPAGAGQVAETAPSTSQAPLNLAPALLQGASIQELIAAQKSIADELHSRFNQTGR